MHVISFLRSSRNTREESCHVCGGVGGGKPTGLTITRRSQASREHTFLMQSSGLFNTVKVGVGMGRRGSSHYEPFLRGFSRFLYQRTALHRGTQTTLCQQHTSWLASLLRSRRRNRRLNHLRVCGYYDAW